MTKAMNGELSVVAIQLNASCNTKHCVMPYFLLRKRHVDRVVLQWTTTAPAAIGKNMDSSYNQDGFVINEWMYESMILQASAPPLCHPRVPVVKCKHEYRRNTG